MEYRSYYDLVKSEDPRNFKIDCKSLNDDSFLIFTPHGGGIEPGTSEICKRIQSNTFSFYLFEGIGNSCKRLHITSTNFDDKKLLEMLNSHDYAVSIHGMNDEVVKNFDIYIGGLNSELILITSEELKKQNFLVVNNITITKSSLSGKEKNNITNRCRTNKGMQIEISEDLRRRFFSGDFKVKRGRMETTDLFNNFCQSIIESMNKYKKNGL